MTARKGGEWLARARQADREGKMAEAIRVFEHAQAASEPLALDDYLDLVALYVEASDFGKRYEIPKDIWMRTYQGALGALAKAEEEFGASAEIDCWRIYVGFREFGEDLPERQQLERWRAQARS